MANRTHGEKRPRTIAQWYCLLAGLSLLLMGLFGFFADATFDTAATAVDSEGGNAGGALQGDSFLGFEVNGWHNVVHLVSGLVLLAAANAAPAARITAITFGVVYGLVALWGLIDGNDVMGLIPVNPADNILHIALSILGVVAGLMSRTFRGHKDGNQGLGEHRDRVGTSTRRDREVPATDGTVNELGSGRFDRTGENDS